MTGIEAIAVAFGLLCVWLTIRQNMLCWPDGARSVALYIINWILAEIKQHRESMYGIIFASRGTAMISSRIRSHIAERIIPQGHKHAWMTGGQAVAAGIALVLLVYYKSQPSLSPELGITRQKQYCSPRLAQYRSDMIIKAVVHKAMEGGYWAEVPSLPVASHRENPKKRFAPTYRRPLSCGWRLSATEVS